MSHLPGCQRASTSATYALYGTCTCETIAQANHTDAMNRLSEDMASARTRILIDACDDSVRLAWCAAHQITFGVERGASGYPDRWIVYKAPTWDLPLGTGPTYQAAIDAAMAAQTDSFSP